MWIGPRLSRAEIDAETSAAPALPELSAVDLGCTARQTGRDLSRERRRHDRRARSGDLPAAPNGAISTEEPAALRAHGIADGIHRTACANPLLTNIGCDAVI
jgi:hypothetical protein